MSNFTETLNRIADDRIVDAVAERLESGRGRWVAGDHNDAALVDQDGATLLVLYVEDEDLELSARFEAEAGL